MDDQQLAGLVMWMPGNMIYFFELMLSWPSGCATRNGRRPGRLPTSARRQFPSRPLFQALNPARNQNLALPRLR